jgi:CheY-like chemotaxis protein
MVERGVPDAVLTLPVLVVDDHPDTCRLLVKLLTIIGCPAVCVESGRAALEFVKATRPSLIILDVMMPDVSGLDVLRELKSDPAFRDVPVIMHSARDDAVTRAIALRDGAQGYLTKTNLGYSELRELVERYVGPLD